MYIRSSLTSIYIAIRGEMYFVRCSAPRPPILVLVVLNVLSGLSERCET